MKIFTDMKIHIIGGGIAGLSLGILLIRAEQPVVIYERRSPHAFAGMGFLLTNNGVKILKELFGDNWEVEKFFTELHSLTLHNLETNVELIQSAEGLWGVRRPILMKRLEDIFVKEGGELKTNHQFVSFRYDDHNGEINGLVLKSEKGLYEEPANFIIGADGIKSNVRTELFPQSKIRPSVLTEYVGLCPLNDQLLDQYPEFSEPKLVKYYQPQSSLAFGMMTIPKQQLIWYAQMRTIPELITEDGEPRRAFVKSCYQDWPEVIQQILDHTPFQRTYRWDSRDLLVMPTAFKSGVMLIGDAAHASLTISSQGVGSALEDAQVFSSFFQLFFRSTKLTQDNWDQFCREFDSQRLPVWLRRQNEARSLQERFLSGDLTDGVPIVKK